MLPALGSSQDWPGSLPRAWALVRSRAYAAGDVEVKYVDGARYGGQRVGVKIEKVIERDGEVFYEGNEAGLDPPTKFEPKLPLANRWTLWEIRS